MLRRILTTSIRSFSAKSSKPSNDALEELLSGSNLSLIPEHQNAKLKGAETDSDFELMFESEQEFSSSIAVDKKSDASTSYDPNNYPDPKNEPEVTYLKQDPNAEYTKFLNETFHGRVVYQNTTPGLSFSFARDELGRNIDDLGELSAGIQEVLDRTNISRDTELAFEEKKYGYHEKPKYFRQRLLRQAKKNRDKGYLVDVLREAIYEPKVFKGHVHWGAYNPSHKKDPKNKSDQRFVN